VEKSGAARDAASPKGDGPVASCQPKRVKASLVLASVAASLALGPCAPSPDPTTPPPGSAGAGGAAISGAAGAPSGGQAGRSGGGGGSGGYVPAGAGGAPPGASPLCVLPPPPWPGPDPKLAELKAALPAALAGAGYRSSLGGWLAYREPRFGAPTPTPGSVLALVPPEGPGWGEAELGVVLSLLVDAYSRPLGGHLEAPKAGCVTCGLRNPCGDAPPRLLGLAFDVADLPGAAKRR
jgi:hypothetical protein